MFFLLIPVALYYFMKKLLFTAEKPKSVENKHVVITGGSSGIGKALAVEAAKRGAHVTILARDTSKLNTAHNEIVKHRQNADQKVTALSVDVSNYEAVEKVLQNLDSNLAPIYMLANCAGFAKAAKLEDTTSEQIAQQMQVNYFGTVYPIRAIIAEMKARNEGVIVLTSSQAGLLGIFGFTAYSASKFALRGFAEALDMEVRPCNISVTVSLPPDTDTPGYITENQGKPKETFVISEAAKLYQPEEVAIKLLDDALVGHFAFIFYSYHLAVIKQDQFCCYREVSS